MSRILKRPMFRKGGTVGIMSGIEDRKRYGEGSIDPELLKQVQQRQALLTKFAGAPSGNALSNLLIRGGLRLAGGVGAGDGTIQAIAKSFAEPTEAFMKEKATEDQFRRQLGLSAATGVLGEQAAEKIQKIKSEAALRKGYESQTFESKVKQKETILEKTLPQYGEGSELRKFIPDIATKSVKFEQLNPGKYFQSSPDLKTFSNVPVGAYFYNPKTGQYYLRRKNTLTNDAFEIVDIRGKSLTKKD